MGDRGGTAGVTLAPAAAVRVPAEPDDVAHRQAGGGGAALRQQGHLAGELAGAQAERVDPLGTGLQRQLARGGPVQPGERAQQRGLAAAVGADQRGDAAGPQCDVGAVDHGAVVVAQVQPDAVEAVRTRTVDGRTVRCHR